LNRTVAIKVSNEQFSERFEREAHAVASLNHSNVCTLHDVGPNYLVMEYIEGTPLKGPMRLEQALKYAAQICDALDAAHRKGITHRDLKPANIMVTKTGIKLLDFGIASLLVLGGLSQVSSAGGTPTPITELEGEERTHRWPQVLPGAKNVLFNAENATVGFDDAKIDVVTLADHRRKNLLRGGTFGRYVAASGRKGYLTYVSRGTLFAVRFDLAKLETSGSPMPVLQQVSYSAMFGSAKLSFSRTGTLMYRSREIDTSRVVIQWMGADGKLQPLLDKPGLFVNPHFSPDGEHLAVANDDTKSGIWIYDIRRDTLSPLTGERNGTNPVWTPDGRYIVYQAGDGISFARADGGSKAELLAQSKEFRYPSAFSPDGRTLAFYQSGGRGFELWTLPVEREGEKLRVGKPELFQSTSFGHRGASFSADGRWMAYSSNESGSSPVYVRAFPDKGGHWQVSSNGGTTPIFSRNGKELFFFDPTDDQIMVASYSVKGDSFVAEKPRV